MVYSVLLHKFNLTVKIKLFSNILSIMEHENNYNDPFVGSMYACLHAN